MHEILLQYLGKKTPCVIDNPILKSSPIKFSPKEPTWVLAGDAEWLMKTNPRMFLKVDERGKEELEDAAAIIAKREEDQRSEDADDEDLGISDTYEEDVIDPFDGKTRQEIADLAQENFKEEIKISGKNRQAIMEEYAEIEKKHLGG